MRRHHISARIHCIPCDPRFFPLLLTILPILFLFFSQPLLAVDAPPIIRNISIVGNTRTLESTIVRELLFHVGEPLDSSIVAETSRNLRQLFFLGNVEIRTRTEGSYADIIVSVKDLYARALTPSLSGEPGELSYGLVAMDYNFLGRGQVIQLSVGHDAISGNWGEAYLRIPRISGSRHRLTANLNVGQEGHDIWGTLSHPFYALSVPLSYGVTAYTQERIQRQYRRQILTRKYTDRLDGGSIWLTRSYGTATKLRPNIRIALSERKFSPVGGFSYAPQSRQRVLPSFGLTVWRPKYEQAYFVMGLGRAEDLQIGSWMTARVGLSHKGLGSDRSFSFYQVDIVPRFKPASRTYVFGSFSLSSRRMNGGYANLFATGSARIYTRIGERHSVALRVQGDALSRPEDSSQFLLGSLRGLRGYTIRRFDGIRRLFANLEARPTVKRHDLFVLAAALFLDAGTAWTPGVDSPELNLAAGIGTRISLTRLYNTPILRADVGYGFRDRTLQLTVGMGQYF